MTKGQQDVYLLLCMAGREDEAEAYKQKVEKEAYIKAAEAASLNTHYVDKHGEKIEAGMFIRIGDGEPEEVFLCGDDNLGVNASNPAYLKAHPCASPECYPLSQFSMADIEIVKGDH